MAYLSFPDDVPARILKLTAETDPLWGQMTAQHMLEHLIVVTKLSYGAIPGKVLTPESEWATRKVFLNNEAPFPRNFQNPALPKEPRPLHYPTFEVAQQKLLGELDRFEAYWRENREQELPHPIFGPLNEKEWRQFHRKHYSHHLAQFGTTEGLEGK